MMHQLEHLSKDVDHSDDDVVAHTVVNDEGIKTALIARSVSVSEGDGDDNDSSSSESQLLDHQSATESEGAEAVLRRRRRMMIGRDGIYRI